MRHPLDHPAESAAVHGLLPAGGGLPGDCSAREVLDLHRRTAAPGVAAAVFRQAASLRDSHLGVTPCGTHIWGGRTAEQPPTVLWAARHFQPDRFGAVNLVSETQAFYRDLFGSGRSAAQVEEILDGGPR